MSHDEAPDERPAVTANGTPDVLVVGGGAIGVACALELARSGARATVLEQGATVAAGCSYGSAGLISPRHAAPLANPTALRQGLRWMLDRSSPFAVRIRPSLVPWLLRFALASTTAQAQRSAVVLRTFAAKSLALHAEYARSGLDTGFQHRGCVEVYETEAGFAAGKREAERPGAQAFPVRVLDAPQLRDLGVVLGTGAVGAIHFAEDAHLDSQRFVAAAGAAAERAGATVRTGVRVTGLVRSGSRIAAVETSEGTLHPGEVVLAAGAWSSRLARQVGVFVPVEGGKGYHVDLAAVPADPQLPVYLNESKVIATPLEGRLRLAGTLELTGLDQRIDPVRLAAVRRSAEWTLGGLSGRAAVETWSGLRPCSADGIPVIGRPAALENLIVATGHTMKGLALAPITGRLVAELVGGRPPSFDLAPLRPDRFTALLGGLL